MPKYNLKTLLGKGKKAKQTQVAKQTSWKRASVYKKAPSVKTVLAKEYAASSSATPTIVCDLGSAWMRMGLAGSLFPQVIKPSLVRLSKAGDPGAIEWNNGEFLAPVDDIKFLHAAQNVSQPASYGRIALDGSTFLLDDGFRRLGVLSAEAEDLSGHNLLVALRPSERTDDREKLFQRLMETYSPDGCSFVCQQAMALFATPARLTGVVLDSGCEFTHAVPVLNGRPLLDAIVTVEVGGSDVTRLLNKNMDHLYNVRCVSNEAKDFVNRLKERIRLIRPISGRYFKNDPPEVFNLPNGAQMVMGADRYQCGEPLFDLSLLSQRRGAGMAPAIVEALSRCPPEVRGIMARNVYPMGGNCKLKGFDERLQEELVRNYPEANVTLQRPDLPMRTTACWMGAASFAGTRGLDRMLVTRAEYEEEGIRACQRKCFLWLHHF